jgi:hypothetical protein
MTIVRCFTCGLTGVECVIVRSNTTGEEYCFDANEFFKRDGYNFLLDDETPTGILRCREEYDSDGNLTYWFTAEKAGK